MDFRKQNHRLLLCFGLLLATCTAIYAATAGTVSRTVGSWGLHFQEEGQPPTGNTNSTVLSSYDAAFLGDPREKTLYLTFDAGYENGHTAEILDILQAHHVPATFFLVGNYLQTHPELVMRMAAEGHTVGNHTWSHPDMSKIENEAAFQKELQQVEEKYQEITGQELPRYYRPPQGTYNEANLELAQKLGYKTVFWSLAYADWNNDSQPTAEEAFSKLIPRTHNGAVILLHSTSATNAAILDELLTRWETMGYRFAPIEELFAR